MAKGKKFKAEQKQYSHNQQIEIQSPESSIRSARNVYAIGSVLATASAVALPVLPVLQLSAAPYLLFKAYVNNRKLKGYHEKFRKLGESRAFVLEGGVIPRELGPDGKPTLHSKCPWGPDYEAPGVGYDMKHADGKEWGISGKAKDIQVNVKVMRDRAKTLPVLKKQEAYLESAHPKRHSAVVRWFSAQHLRAYVRARYPFIPDCQILRANGSISPEFLEALRSMFGAVASQAARRMFSILPKAPVIQVTFEGKKPTFSLTLTGQQVCERWLQANDRVIKLVDRRLALALCDEGYPDQEWFSLNSSDKPSINPISLDIIQERFDNIVCGYLGIASPSETNPEDWKEEMENVLNNDIGFPSVRKWMHHRIKETRAELGPFIEQATSPKNILDLITPACTEAISDLLTAHGTITEWAESIISEARETLEVDYYEGVRLALQPKLWEDRLEILPRLKAISVLRKQLYHIGDTTEDPQDAYPRLTTPVSAGVFLGKGFFWDVDHTKLFQEQISHNLGELTKRSKDYGDPRIYGIGLENEESVFLEEAVMNSHCGIWGSSGVGKTRFAEPIITQAIRGGFGVVVVDPKGDEQLVNRVFEEARRYGRGNDVHLFSLASPRNEHISSYSCLYNYRDPADLGSRVASTLVNSKDPFWKNSAVAASKAVCTLAHWMQRYVAFVQRDEDGNAGHKHSKTAPFIFPALSLLSDDPSLTPAEAERKVRHIRAKMKERGWQPTHDESTIVEMLSNDMYRPVTWTPSMKMVGNYAVARAYTFLAWSLRLVYGHLYGSSEEERRADFPDIVDEASVIAMSSGKDKQQIGQKPSLWQRYLNKREHPLERRFIQHAKPLDDEGKRIIEFYDYFVPHRASETESLVRIFTGIHEAMEDIHELASRDAKTRSQHLSTLTSSLARFGGERDRILNSIQPDIVFPRFMAKQQIIYIHLASLIDPDGSSGICKVVTADLVSYLGEIEAYAHENRKPFYFVGDEISSWINESAIDLLARGRSAGARATLIGQSTPDLEALLGDRAKAQQVIANMSTSVQLRTKVESDADAFSRMAGSVNITTESRNVSFTPGYGQSSGHGSIDGFSANEGRSFQEKETTKVPSAAIMNLPRGQAFVHSVGGVNLVAAGLLPDPEWDVFKEFGILDGTAGAKMDLDPDLQFVEPPNYDPLYHGSPLISEKASSTDLGGTIDVTEQEPQVVEGPAKVASHELGSGTRRTGESQESSPNLYGESDSKDGTQGGKKVLRTVMPAGATRTLNTNDESMPSEDLSIDAGETYTEDEDLY